MPVLTANVRRAAEAATLQFDWLVPDKPMLRVAEVVAATGMRTTVVEEFFADRCHRFFADERTRAPMRIPRAFVVAELVKSAKYDAETKVQAVESLAREFTPAECVRLATAFMRSAHR